jgi:hypothetical protein
VGFTCLNSILALIGFDFNVLLFIVSLFVSVSVVVFVNKFSTDKFMSIFLYIALGVFAQSLNTMRQIIAMAFILLAIKKLFDKSFLKSILLILTASMFHVSAMVCMIFVILLYLKPNLAVVLTSFVVTIIGSYAFPYIMKFIEMVTPLNYYTRYFVDYRGYLSDINIIDILYSIGLIGVFIVCWVGRYKILKFNKEKRDLYDYFLILFMFVPLIRIAGSILSAQALLNRLSMYFFMVLIVLIPLFVDGLKYDKKLYKMANIMVYIVAGGYMYYLYAIKVSCGVVPYLYGF